MDPNANAKVGLLIKSKLAAQDSVEIQNVSTKIETFNPLSLNGMFKIYLEVKIIENFNKLLKHINKKRDENKFMFPSQLIILKLSPKT